jgi:hypothetical protein
MLTLRVDADISRKQPLPAHIERHDSETHFIINKLVTASQDEDTVPLNYMFAPLNMGPGGRLARISLGVRSDSCTP